MDANPFQSARNYLNSRPAAKWGGVLSSAGASVCLALLLLVLYLFVDLIVWRGHVPEYAALGPAQQRAFRAEWNNGLGESPDAAAALERVRHRSVIPAEGDAADWPFRWRAATYARLAERVGPEAAEAYLPLEAERPANAAWVAPSPNRLGVLSTVAHDRHGWTSSLVAWLARWNGWAWRPGADGTANVSYLSGLFVVALVLLLLRGILLNVSAHLAAQASLEAGTRLRRALYTHAQRLTAVAVRPDAQEEAGLLVTRRVEQIQEGLTAWLTGTVRWQVLTVLLVLVLLSVHFWFGLSLLLVAGVVWLVVGQAAAWFRRDARLANRRADARLGLMRESISLMHLVKAYLMERFSQNRFERHLADLSRAIWRRERGETFSRPTLLAILSLVVAVLLYLSALVVLAGGMSVAGLAVKAAALAALVYGLNRWIAARVRVGRAQEAAADVFEFLGRRGDAGQAMDAEFLPPMTKKLEMVEVSLRESGTGRMALEGVSLTIPAGSRAAVVFADADEAYALAHLITRFTEPTAGEVRIDGKNIRWVTAESVRAQVAVVLESSLTFTDTVANNIGCGDTSFTLPQIIEAAKVAHAHQFVQRLPYGYETLIGDGGVILRPGERYRVALARAILRDPSLVVIEEPSEPLDADSLALIDDTIARIAPGRTLLFLARRASTVRSADRVFVLQHGRVTATGSHDELLNGSELYRLLHFKQSLTPSGSP